MAGVADAHARTVVVGRYVRLIRVVAVVGDDGVAGVAAHAAFTAANGQAEGFVTFVGGVLDGRYGYQQLGLASRNGVATVRVGRNHGAIGQGHAYGAQVVGFGFTGVQLQLYGYVYVGCLAQADCELGIAAFVYLASVADAHARTVGFVGNGAGAFGAAAIDSGFQGVAFLAFVGIVIVGRHLDQEAGSTCWHLYHVANHVGVVITAIEADTERGAGVVTYRGGTRTQGKGDIGNGGAVVAQGNGEGVALTFGHGVANHALYCRQVGFVSNVGRPGGFATVGLGSQGVALFTFVGVIVQRTNLYLERGRASRYGNGELAIRAQLQRLLFAIDDDGDAQAGIVLAAGCAVVAQRQVDRGCGGAVVAQGNGEGVLATFFYRVAFHAGNLRQVGRIGDAGFGSGTAVATAGSQRVVFGAFIGFVVYGIDLNLEAGGTGRHIHGEAAIGSHGNGLHHAVDHYAYGSGISTYSGTATAELQLDGGVEIVGAEVDHKAVGLAFRNAVTSHGQHFRGHLQAVGRIRLLGSSRGISQRGVQRCASNAFAYAAKNGVRSATVFTTCTSQTGGSGFQVLQRVGTVLQGGQYLLRFGRHGGQRGIAVVGMAEHVIGDGQVARAGDFHGLAVERLHFDIGIRRDDEVFPHRYYVTQLQYTLAAIGRDGNDLASDGDDFGLLAYRTHTDTPWTRYVRVPVYE